MCFGQKYLSVYGVINIPKPQNLNIMRILTIALLILGITNLVNSQSSTNSNNKFSLGFNIGMNYSLLKAKEYPLPNDAEFINDLGYQMGIIAEYRFSDKMSLNPRIEVVFNNGIVQFGDGSGIQGIHEVLPVGLDIMTYLTYRISDSKNRPYIFIGPDVKLSNLEKVRSTLIFESGTDIAIDAGIGFEVSTNRYTFSPELRYSYGLTTFSHPHLQPFYLHSISFVVNVM